MNLAAVHYHFNSKEGLLEAVVHWRMAPVNQERLKRLEQLEARGGPEELSWRFHFTIGALVHMVRSKFPSICSPA